MKDSNKRRQTCRITPAQAIAGIRATSGAEGAEILPTTPNAPAKPAAKAARLQVETVNGYAFPIVLQIIVNDVRRPAFPWEKRL